MIESFLLKGLFSAKGEQYSIVTALLICVGWCIMKIRGITKTQSLIKNDLKFKAEIKMCEQRHNDIDVHMNDLKRGNENICKKIDGIVNILLQKK